MTSSGESMIQHIIDAPCHVSFIIDHRQRNSFLDVLLAASVGNSIKHFNQLCHKIWSVVWPPECQHERARQFLSSISASCVQWEIVCFTSQIVPLVGNAPYMKSKCRTNVGGAKQGTLEIQKNYRKTHTKTMRLLKDRRK